ncbi:MAG: hypothetical protein ACRDOO_07745 [Actinomadura sp.]
MTWFTFLPAVITMALGISLGRVPLPSHHGGPPDCSAPSRRRRL